MVKLKVAYTDGRQPIGHGIGPVLEMRDVIEVLKNIPFEIGKTFNILRGYINIDQFQVERKTGKLE